MTLAFRGRFLLLNTSIEEPVTRWGNALMKKYIVRLTEAERERLRSLTTKGQAAAYRIKHANILL